MDIELLSFSIVILGDLHNPTIINKDFLNIQEMVLKEWEWEVNEKGIITTPPVSQVPFNNGVVIRVEPNKAHFTDENIKNPEDSKIQFIAEKYVHTLKHIRYKAIGSNFNCVVEKPSPEKFLRERFLKNDDLNIEGSDLNAVGLRLVYGIDFGRLVLALDAGRINRSGENGDQEVSVVIANANFHRECTEYPADDQIEIFLNRIPVDWAQLSTIISRILSE